MIELGRYRVTAYQAEEALGLLGVCTDEAATNGDRAPWGRVESRDGLLWLVVTDRVDAVDDLRYRADCLAEEGASGGANVTGLSGARSLRRLADLIDNNQ